MHSMSLLKKKGKETRCCCSFSLTQLAAGCMSPVQGMGHMFLTHGSHRAWAGSCPQYGTKTQGLILATSGWVALSSLLGVAGAECKARQAPGDMKALSCAHSGGQQHSLDPLNMLCQGNQVFSSSFWAESRRAVGQHHSWSTCPFCACLFSSCCALTVSNPFLSTVVLMGLEPCRPCPALSHQPGSSRAGTA